MLRHVLLFVLPPASSLECIAVPGWSCKHGHCAGKPTAANRQAESLDAVGCASTCGGRIFTTREPKGCFCWDECELQTGNRWAVVGCGLPHCKLATTYFPLQAPSAGPLPPPSFAPKPPSSTSAKTASFGQAHDTTMEPTRCAVNPFLDERIIKPSDFAATEARAAHFHSVGIARLLTKRLNEFSPIRWPARVDRKKYHVEASQPIGRARWDVMPVLGTCDRLELLQEPQQAGRGRWDGSTHACGLDALGEACTVVSVGSHNQFDFEREIVRRTRCRIEILDCTVANPRLPPEVAARARFHQLCLGGEDGWMQGMQFVTWRSLVGLLGLRRVDVMRLNVEGHEHSILLSMLEDERFASSSAPVPLPHQLVTEFHYQHGDGYEGLDWAGRYLTMGELAQLAQALYHGGYRTVFREFNPKWPQCVELTLVRYRCDIVAVNRTKDVPVVTAADREMRLHTQALAAAEDGRCAVVVHCFTGLADRTFDIIAGVVAAQLARGCAVPTVHVADRGAGRTYDWDAVLASPEFIVRKRPYPMPWSGGPLAQALHMGGAEKGEKTHCGQHGVSWLRDVLLREGGRQASEAELRARLVRVARSVRLSPCNPPDDIAERVGVHARRGDKLQLGWTSEKKLAKVYEATVAWLVAHGERRVYFATDGPSFGARLAARMRKDHIDVVYHEAADAAADLCALSRSKLVMKAGSASQFSSLAAAISGAPMVSFADERGRALDRAWKSGGLLANVTELEPGAETGAPTRGRGGNGSSEGGGKAAYVYGLVGSACADRHRLSLLTGISVLLATEPVFPVVVMLVGPAAQQDGWLVTQLHALGVKTLNVTAVTGAQCAKPNARSAYFLPTYSLFAAWSLTAFDAVLYLDSDLTVAKNLDHVLRRMLSEPQLREIRTPIGCVGIEHERGRVGISAPHLMNMNVGVWALRPNLRTFQELVRFVRSGDFECGVGFQQAAYVFFSLGTTGVSGRRSPHATPKGAVEALHVGYNLKADLGVSSCLKKRQLSNPADVYVVHWSGTRKPETLSTADNAELPHLRSWQAAHQGWQRRLRQSGGSCERQVL